MRCVVLDLNQLRDIKKVHEYIKEEMGFSDYYGENLDALYDMLTDLSENICVELHFCSDTDLPMFEYGRKLERVMEDAAQTVEYTEDGRMFAVFEDKRPMDFEGTW